MSHIVHAEMVMGRGVSWLFILSEVYLETCSPWTLHGHPVVHLSPKSLVKGEKDLAEHTHTKHVFLSVQRV